MTGYRCTQSGKRLRLSYRIFLWCRRPLSCKFGFHALPSEWEVSTAAGSGIVNYHCPRCQKVIRRIPLDDAPAPTREALLRLLAAKDLEDLAGEENP